jgi:hypothetical protein
MPKAEIRLGKVCPFILDLFGTKRTVKAEVQEVTDQNGAWIPAGLESLVGSQSLISWTG